MKLAETNAGELAGQFAAPSGSMIDTPGRSAR